MNPVFNKRRLPSSLRSLLTDIGPREQWTVIGPDPEFGDEIIVPPRGAAAGPEELLTLANDEQAVDGQGNHGRSPVCMLCKCKPYLYTCPRCNLPYCSLSCYKSLVHSSCSENFYKESVLQELKEMGKPEDEGRKKMQEILIGLRKKAEMTDGGMESLFKKEGVLSSEQGQVDTKINIEAVELLSRLAELQESEEDNAEELETILEKLQNIGGIGDDAENDLDENNSDMDERLQDLDIDGLSEEQLWGLLNKQEKEKFSDLLKHGALGGLIPLWKPWWEQHEEDGRVLVEVLQEEMSKRQKGQDDTIESLQEIQHTKCNPKVKRGRKVKEKETKNIQCVPPISTKIPMLTSLCSNPSPLVGFSLVNALFGYTFTLSFFNGDTDSLVFELCDMILVLSEVLSSNKVFNSVHEAVDSGETLILGGGCLDRDNLSAPARAVEAVAHILTGRNREDPTGYCLSALSQLRSLLSQARAALSKEGNEGSKRQKYFLASKKCEFLQSWVLKNSHNIIMLAIELWSEHSKREGEKMLINKAKAVVEQSWKKGMSRGASTLIEEL